MALRVGVEIGGTFTDLVAFETGADGSRVFKFILGPVFCQLLMVDEINRVSLCM